MRKTRSKIIVLAFTTVFCFIAAILGFFNFGNVASVKAGSETAPFRIEQGFSIRATAPDGLRVMVTVDNKAELEGATFGTLFIPEKYYDNNLTVEKNGDEFILGHEQIINVVTSAWNDNSYNSVIVAAKSEDGEYQSFSNAVMNMPIVAVGYYIVEGENPVYTNIVTRSMAYVAVCNYVNEDVAPKIEEIVAIADSSLTVNGGEELVIGEEYDATFTVGGMLADTSDKVEVSYTSNATDVVKVENGKIIPVKGGTATITATISGENGVPFEKSVEVTVAKPVVDVSTIYDYGIKNQSTLFIKESDLTDVPVKATIGETEVDIATVEGGYQVDGAQFTALGEKTLTVETESTVEKIKVNCVTAVISNKTDVQKMKTYAEHNENDNTYQGSFVLANDVDMEFADLTDTTVIWGTIQFDGKGFAISNFTTTDGLFGNQMNNGYVKNLAVLNAGPNKNFGGVLFERMNGGSLENIYVSGSIYDGAQTSLLVRNFSNGLVKNILVNVQNSTKSDSSAIAKMGDTPDGDYGKYFTNVYSIDNSKTNKIKHVAYSYQVQNGNSTLTYYSNLDSSVGGYSSEAAFFADKDQIFKGEFAEVFSVGEDGNGLRVIKFFGRTLKYSMGYKNQDLIISASDFDGEVTAVTSNSTVLEYTVEDNGNIKIAGDNFTQVSDGVDVIIETTNGTFCKVVRVVTAILMKVEDLKKMGDWAEQTPYSDYESEGLAQFTKTSVGNLKVNNCLAYKATYLLGKDIDFGANNTTAFACGYKVATSDGHCWAGLYFDGQGYEIRNIYTNQDATSCLFGQRAVMSTIKNLSIVDATVSTTKATGTTNGVLLSECWYGTVIENVFLQGKAVGATSTVRAFMLVTGTDGNGKIVGANNTNETTVRIRNVVIDVTSTEYTANTSGVPTSSAYPRIYMFERMYTIGTIYNVSVGNPISGQAASNNSGYIGGGYATGADFLADVEANKDTDNAVFAGTFTDVFELAEVGGVTVLKFFDRVVKEFEQ